MLLGSAQASAGCETVQELNGVVPQEKVLVEKSQEVHRDVAKFKEGSDSDQRSWYDAK